MGPCQEEKEPHIRPKTTLAGGASVTGKRTLSLESNDKNVDLNLVSGE